MKTTKNITGRDGMIIVQGLLYGIAAIQALPEHQQPFSNMVDMCAIARALGAHDNWTILVYEIECKLGVEIELWPDREAMTKLDVAKRNDHRAEIEGIHRQRKAA